MSEPGDNEDQRLDEFARRLAESLPTLSEDAMQRVEQAMRREFSRVRRRQLVVKLTSAAALVATLLVAVGILVSRHDVGPRPGQGKVPQDEVAVPEDQGEVAPVVEDRFVVAVTMPVEGTSDPPLLPLEDYRSLIEDVN